MERALGNAPGGDDGHSGRAIMGRDRLGLRRRLHPCVHLGTDRPHARNLDAMGCLPDDRLRRRDDLSGRADGLSAGCALSLARHHRRG